MAEETEKKTTKKIESRKFIVWLIWCLIAAVVMAYCVVVVVVTKDFTDNLSTLIEKVLGWFFGVSMMYIGANAGQKVGFALADSMATKKDEAAE